MLLVAHALRLLRIDLQRSIELDPVPVAQRVSRVAQLAPNADLQRREVELRVPLRQAFAFFGLSFFIVPALANRFLGDPVTIYTWIGATVIVAGIVLTAWKPS